MHRIVKSHLSDFVSNMGFDALSESDQFERFANYCITLGYCPTTIEPDEITTGSDDSGIDGLAVIIDEEIVLSKISANEIFSDNKRNHEVRFIAIQAKTSESFDLGDVLKFTSSIERLYLSNNDTYESNEVLEQSVSSIFNLAIEKANKIRGGRPNITCAYVTTGVYSNPKEIQRAFDETKSKFERSGIFESVEFRFIDRDGLIKIWSDCKNGVEAKLELHNVAAMPKIEHITESYLAVVNAKELVANLLQDEDGRLRAYVFEENVRSFLGDENPVNTEIRNTILDPAKCMMFPVLNNGITIVSPDVVMQGTIANLNGFQIVNGCQTSNVLFREKDNLPAEMMVNVKIIETSNNDVLSELVRATNSQSKIDNNQFFSLKPISKNIEHYFNSFNGGEGRIYFERRDRQYVGTTIPAIRIFNLTTIAKCVTAMFIERPDLSSRYQKRMFDVYGEKIFDVKNKEIIYYTSCIVLYRLHLLVASGSIAQNTRKFKWHLLYLVRIMIAGENMPNISSKKIEGYCNKIIKIFSERGQNATNAFNEALAIIHSLPDLSDESLKRATSAKDLAKLIK